MLGLSQAAKATAASANHGEAPLGGHHGTGDEFRRGLHKDVALAFADPAGAGVDAMSRPRILLGISTVFYPIFIPRKPGDFCYPR